MSKFVLLRDLSDPTSLIFEPFQEFERSILSDSEVKAAISGKIGSYSRSAVFRIMRTVGSRLGISAPYELGRDRGAICRIAVLAGPSFIRCSDFIWRGTKAVYLYDACEPWVSKREVVRFVKDAGIQYLFLPHPGFISELAPELEGHCVLHYIPEACEAKSYFSEKEKTLDIISFGRKLNVHHEALVKELPPDISYHYSYLPTHQDFVMALASARISICFPRSRTDPRCEFELATMRYFQSMASKTLILGECPPLLQKMFGYNPCVEVEFEDPVGQVKEILENYHAYKALIEKNHQQILSFHTYEHRWREMKEVLENRV